MDDVYNSYNCGHDDAIFELIGRYADWSSNQGVTYYSASGAWLPSDCPVSEDNPPYCSEEFEPEKLSDYQEQKIDSNYLEEQKYILNSYFEAKSSITRFSSWMKPDENAYQGVVAHGFNVWEQNPKCTFISKNIKALNIKAKLIIAT